jgi:hypothetical protein
MEAVMVSFKLLPQHLPEETEEDQKNPHRVRTTSALAKIQTTALLNTNQNCYYFTTYLSSLVFITVKVKVKVKLSLCLTH